MYKDERTRRGFFNSDTMVGDDELTVERWTVGEQQLKREMEKEEIDVTQGEEVKKEEPDEKKPDFIQLFLNNIVDGILYQEVTVIGMKMNKYRGILAKAILEFAGEHEEDLADLSRMGDAFRAGWKVYREKEDEKATVDAFMEAMNNRLWIPKSDVIAE